jgi:ribosome-associated heat shock protein Hsp15
MASDDAGARVRVDSWVWAVRLFRTRSLAAAACRAGHVKVAGERAKPSTPVRVGDEVHARTDAGERIVVVRRTITKRVGAAIAVDAYEDHSPPPPPKEVLASMPRRDRGAGRPTKRERRQLDRLLGHGAPPPDDD